VDFCHTIIIATSNAGANYIKEEIEKGNSLTQNFQQNLINQLLKNGIFTPEFLNRFDAIVLYRPLNIQEMQQVTNLMLKEIQVGLSQKGIEFQITPNLIEKLTQIGFDPVFGGRALRRALQNNIENPLARALLAHTIQPGEIIEIDPSTWQVNIKKKIN